MANYRELRINLLNQYRSRASKQILLNVSDHGILNINQICINYR